MIDERELSERFHVAFSAEAPLGAAQRLRAELLRPARLRAYSRAPHSASRVLDAPTAWGSALRVVAGFLAVALVVAGVAVFVALRHESPPIVPAGPSPSHAFARQGPGPVMVTSKIGWAVGSFDVWRTTDGGATWGDVKPHGAAQMYNPAASYFLDATHAWILVGTGQLSTYRTADGGKTWTAGRPVNPSSTSPKAVLYFLDESHGWMLLGAASIRQGHSSEQLLLVTQDGGLHWANVASNPPSAQCGWLNVALASPTVGWITLECNVWVMGGPGFLLATRDGGITWSPENLPLAKGSETGIVDPGTGIRYTSDCPVMGPEYAGVATCHLGSLAVLDQDNVAVVIWSEANVAGQLFVTSDGGRTWSVRPLPAHGDPALGDISVSFIDEERGWALDGAKGLLFRTTDGGVSWTRLASDGATGLQEIFFVDSKHGFGDARNEFFATTDGGMSWRAIRPGPYGTPCLGLPGPPNYCPS